MRKEFADPSLKKITRIELEQKIEALLLRLKELGESESQLHALISGGCIVYDENGEPVRVLGDNIDAPEHKRTEERLRVKEADLELILERTPFMITRCSRDLRYLYVSRAYAEMIGLTPDQVAGRPIIEIMGAKGLQTILPHVEAVLRGETVEYESEIAFEGVGLKHLSVTYVPDMNGNLVIGWIASIRDITKRYRAEEALRESEERFRIAQELSLDAFTILEAVRDSAGLLTDFRWTYVNPAAGRVLRHPPADLVGKYLLEVLPGNKADSNLFERYVRVVETGEAHDCEVYYQSEGIDGWFRNMAVKCGDGIAICFTDITDRKRTELALAESEQRYRGIVETAQEGIATHDPDGTITYVNQRMADMLGYSRDEIVGRSSLDFVPDEDREEVIRARRSVKERGSASKEWKVRRKDGSVLWTLANVSMRQNSTGNFLGYLAMHTDITERKQAEMALRLSEEKFAKAFAHSTTAIAITDLEDGKYLDVNETWLAMFGYKREESWAGMIWI